MDRPFFLKDGSHPFDIDERGEYVGFIAFDYYLQRRESFYSLEQSSSVGRDERLVKSLAAMKIYQELIIPYKGAKAFVLPRIS